LVIQLGLIFINQYLVIIDYYKFSYLFNLLKGVSRVVVCIIAMFVFGFLAIFSAKYRPLAKDAFSCVWLKLTFRPCDIKLDERIKAGVVGKLMDKSPGTAKFVNKHFEAISFVFTILLFASLAYSLYSLYNFFVFGSCDPSDPSSCILTVLTNGTTTNTTVCTITADFAEFYGAECPHCIKMEPTIAKVESETGIKFEKLEIWHNESNSALMKIHEPEILRDCGINGFPTPTFISIKNRVALCGEVSEEQLKAFVLKNK